MLKAAAVVTVALSLFVAGPAAAQSKSWTAVKGSVTPQAAFVFGANFDPIRKTASYATALKMFLDQEDDAKQAFELVKTHCQIDVPNALTDATAIMKADEKPLVVLGLNGLDEPKVVACLEKIVMSFAPAGTAPIKLVAKKKGKVTEYTVPGESKKIYIAWLAADVLAFTDDPIAKGKLEKMLAGKAPKGEVGKMLAKVATTAPIWFAVAKKEREAGIGTVLGGYGQIDIAGTNVNVTGHLIMAKASEASQATLAGNQGLEEAKRKAAKIPAAKKLLDTVTIVANGKEVDIKGTVADKDIVTLVPDLDKLF